MMISDQRGLRHKYAGHQIPELATLSAELNVRRETGPTDTEAEATTYSTTHRH